MQGLGLVEDVWKAWSNMIIVAPWVNWRLQDATCFVHVTTDILNHNVVASLSWLYLEAKVWNVCK